MKIILGSQSVGRRRMLEEMGLKFEIMAADIDEKAIRQNNPKKLVLSIANAKADFLLAKISEPVILITGDAVVLCNGKVLEKPENEKEAREFLQAYGKYPAQTVTAVLATNTKSGKRAGAVDTAKVYFSSFGEKEINEIIKQGQVFKFAGGFMVEEEPWQKHVLRIEGARDSVIGLPKEITKNLINQVI